MENPRPARPDALALLGLLAGAVIIAGSPIFVRLSEAGPTATAFWRVALAAPVWWVIDAAFRRDGSDRSTRTAPLLWLAAGAFAGDLALWHASIRLTSVANSTLLSNLATIFVTLGAWIFWRQRPRPLFLGGLAAALVGVALLVRSSLSFSATALRGDVVAVVTAVFYAAYLMAVKGLRGRGLDTPRLMSVTSTLAALLLLPITLATGEALTPSSPRGWLVLAGLAASSQVVGQGLIAWALAHLPAAFSSVTLLVQPVAAAVFAWAFLQEPLTATQAIAGVIVLGGIYLARRGST